MLTSRNLFRSIVKSRNLFSRNLFSRKTKTIRENDDFYEYHNRDWLLKTEIPLGYSSWGVFEMMHENNLTRIKKLFDTCPNSDLRTWFKTAQNINDINRKELDPLAKYFQLINNLNNITDLSQVIIQLQKIGVPIFYYPSLTIRYNQVFPYILANNNLSKEQLNCKYLEDYRKQNYDILSTFPNYFQDIEKLLDVFINLEIDLANLTFSKTEQRNVEQVYHTKISNDLYPVLKWNLDFKMFQEDMFQEKTFIIDQPKYFSELNRRLISMDLDLLKTYLKFQLVKTYLQYIPKYDFLEIKQNIKETPRWKRIIGWSNKHLGELVGQIYVEKYFSKDDKSDIDLLIKDIINAFSERILELDWMSGETKFLALKKLENLKVKIGYPENWTDYTELNLVKDCFLTNVIKCNIFSYQEWKNKLYRFDNNEWSILPQVVNARYDETRNEIIFPAAILQPPFYSSEADLAENYGAIGAIIGHEITHGFDDQGRKYDCQGNLNNWWTEEDLIEFEKRRKKLVDQYNESKILECNLNGELTQGENIADLGGLNIAYQAMVNRMKKNNLLLSEESKKKFFISWSNSWKRIMTDEFLKTRLLSDPHPPEKFRVNIPLSNMNEFHQAFNLKPEDKMYRPLEERVNIW